MGRNGLIVVMVAVALVSGALVSGAVVAQPVRPVVPPVVVPVIVPVPLPSTLTTSTPLQSVTPAPSLKVTPLPLAAPAPSAAVPSGAGGGACKSARDCGQDSAQCLANKAITRGDAQNASSYFVQYDAAGRPSVVRYLGDIASEREETDAAECGGELQMCLAKACGQ